MLVIFKIDFIVYANSFRLLTQIYSFLTEEESLIEIEFATAAKLLPINENFLKTRRERLFFIA